MAAGFSLTVALKRCSSTKTASSAGAWRERIQGLRANASTLSHAELDVMTQLDSGNPHDLADRYRRLRTPLSRLNVLGGCCGTDHRHVAAICEAWSMAR